MTLIEEIEAFMAAQSMSATAFGQKAINDPRFVHDLRNGRDFKSSTGDRVRKFMAEYLPDAQASAA